MAPAGHTLLPRPPSRESDLQHLASRVGGTMALVGSATSYLGALTLPLSAFAQLSQLLLAAGLTVLGVVLFVARPNTLLHQILTIWAVFTMSTMLATTEDFGTTPFFYLWPAVFAAYFCSARFLAITMVAIVGTLIPALLSADVAWAMRIDIFVGTTACVGMMAGLVALMRAREARLNDQLAHAAHTDPLTGLLNRRGFDPPFADLIASCVSQDRPISVVMFDLDHFKRFNDRHGHLVGDEALRRVATILAGQGRDVDLVARLGGEEFAVVLPGAGTDEARSYAERVAWALGTEDIDASLRLSTSSGVGSFAPGDESVSALVLRADEALYAAKAAGRARSAWWHEGELVIGEPVTVPDPVSLAHFAPVPRAYVQRRSDRLEQELQERTRA